MDNSKNICDRCKAGPMTISELKKHIKNSICRGKYNPCTRCNACFLTEKELEDHKDCPKTVYYCRKCCMGPYKDIDEFQDHFRHRSDCKKLHTICPHCSHVSMNVDDLQDHFTGCSNMVNCEICDERFGKSINYSDHYLECSRSEISRLKSKVKDLKIVLEDDCGENLYRS